MDPAKVIVHGIPAHFGDSTSPGDCINQMKEKLEELLEEYGPVMCVSLESNQASHSFSPSAKRRRMNDVGGENYKIAHMLFENAEDAERACHAAANREIQLGENLLTLIPASGSSKTIDNLNNETLLKIFSMLSPQDKLIIEEAPVCARWQNLIKDTWPNTKQLCVLGSHFPETKFIKLLRKCGKYLKQLECTVSCSTFLDLILEYCPNLKTLELNIYWEDFEPTAFSRMFVGLKHLRELKLDHLDDDSQLSFLEHLPESMKTISLTCCSSVNGNAIFDLAKYHTLKRLYLCGYDILGRHLEGIEHLGQLTDLEFDDCITHRSVTRKLEHLTMLKSLKIPKSGITDDILTKIITNNPGLECLDISKAPALTDRSVELVSTLDNLKVLNISKLCVSLTSINRLPSLVELQCKECESLTNKTVGRLIRRAPKLQHLDVCDTPITTDLFLIADAALQQREDGLGLMIVTNESFDEWEGRENLSSLLRIQIAGGKEGALWLGEYAVYDNPGEDMNDERENNSSDELFSDD